MRSIEEDLSILTEFCDRMGFEYTIDRNPSAEKKKKIEHLIGSAGVKSKRLMAALNDDYRLGLLKID